MRGREGGGEGERGEERERGWRETHTRPAVYLCSLSTCMKLVMSVTSEKSSLDARDLLLCRCAFASPRPMRSKSKSMLCALSTPAPFPCVRRGKDVWSTLDLRDHLHGLQQRGGEREACVCVCERGSCSVHSTPQHRSPVLRRETDQHQVLVIISMDSKHSMAH